MRVTIRPYRKRDGRDLVRLICGLARFEKLAPPTPAARRRIVADAGKRFRVLMAHAGDTPVGYALYFFTYSTFRGRPTLFLEDLFVDPDHRGGGVGRRLFEHVQREAKREKCGRMEWQVLDWNTRAQKFYRRKKARPLADWITFRLTFR